MNMERDYIGWYGSPLGRMLMASDGEALVGLWFEGQEHFGEGLRAERVERMVPVMEETVRWLDCYFGGKVPGFMPALQLRGTPYRRAVWRILMEIPYGQTVTYGEIAARLAGTAAQGRLAGLGSGSIIARAVGGAVGHNPVSLIVPCHRVVGADGGLTGYAGGLERKRRLLRLEGLSF